MISKEVFEMQSQLCQAMGHAARMEIVHILRDGPQHVHGLARVMGLSQATLSRHLAILRNSGLVIVQRQGQENIYQLANPKIVVICDLIRQVLAEQITHQAEAANILAKRA
jgi:DNA-binding transcriptional ArsR family regulator